MELEIPGFMATQALLPTQAQQQTALDPIADAIGDLSDVSQTSIMTILAPYSADRQIHCLNTLLRDPGTLPVDVGVLFAAVVRGFARLGDSEAIETAIDAVLARLHDSSQCLIALHTAQALATSMIQSLPLLSTSKCSQLLVRILTSLDAASEATSLDQILPTISMIPQLAFRYAPTAENPAPDSCGRLAGLFGERYAGEAFKQLLDQAWYPAHTYDILSCVGDSPFACAIAAPAVQKAIAAVRLGARHRLRAGLPLSQGPSSDEASVGGVQDVPAVVLACMKLAARAATAPGVSAADRATSRDASVRALLAVFDPLTSEGAEESSAGFLPDDLRENTSRGPTSSSEVPPLDAEAASGDAAWSPSAQVELVEECCVAAHHVASVVRLQSSVGRAILRLIRRGVVPLTTFPMLCCLAMAGVRGIEDHAVDVVSSAIVEQCARQEQANTAHVGLASKRKHLFAKAASAVDGIIRAAQAGSRSIDVVLEPLVEVCLRLIRICAINPGWRGGKGLQSWPGAAVRETSSGGGLGRQDRVATWALGLPSPTIANVTVPTSGSVPPSARIGGLALSILRRIATQVRDAHPHVVRRLVMESAAAVRATRTAASQKQTLAALRSSFALLGALRQSLCHKASGSIAGGLVLTCLIDAARGCDVQVTGVVIRALESELAESAGLRDHACIAARKMAYSRDMREKVASVALATELAKIEAMAIQQSAPGLFAAATSSSSSGGKVGTAMDGSDEMDDFGEDDILQPSQVALASKPGEALVLDSGASTVSRPGAAQSVADLLRLAQQTAMGYPTALAILYEQAAAICQISCGIAGSTGDFLRKAADGVLMRGWSSMGLRLVDAPPAGEDGPVDGDIPGSGAKGGHAASSSSGKASDQFPVGSRSHYGVVDWAKVAEQESNYVQSVDRTAQSPRFSSMCALIRSSASLLARDKGDASEPLESCRCAKSFFAWVLSAQNAAELGVDLPDERAVKQEAEEAAVGAGISQAPGPQRSAVSASSRAAVGQDKFIRELQSAFLGAEAAAAVIAEMFAIDSRSAKRNEEISALRLSALRDEVCGIGQQAWQNLYLQQQASSGGPQTGILGKKRKRVKHQVSSPGSFERTLSAEMLAAAAFAAEAPAVQLHAAVGLVECVAATCRTVDDLQHVSGALAAACDSIRQSATTAAEQLDLRCDRSSGISRLPSAVPADSIAVELVQKACRSLAMIAETLQAGPPEQTSEVASASSGTGAEQQTGEGEGAERAAGDGDDDDDDDDDEEEEEASDLEEGNDERLNTTASSYQTAGSGSEDEAIGVLAAQVRERKTSGKKAKAQRKLGLKASPRAGSKSKIKDDLRILLLNVVTTLGSSAVIAAQSVLFEGKGSAAATQFEQSLFSHVAQVLHGFLLAPVRSLKERPADSVRDVVRACLALEETATTIGGDVSPLVHVPPHMLARVYTNYATTSVDCGCLALQGWTARTAAESPGRWILDQLYQLARHGGDDSAGSSSSSSSSAEHTEGDTLIATIVPNWHSDASLAIETQRALSMEIAELEEDWEFISLDSKLPAVSQATLGGSLLPLRAGTVPLESSGADDSHDSTLKDAEAAPCRALEQDTDGDSDDEEREPMFTDSDSDIESSGSKDSGNTSDEEEGDNAEEDAEEDDEDDGLDHRRRKRSRTRRRSAGSAALPRIPQGVDSRGDPGNDGTAMGGGSAGSVETEDAASVAVAHARHRSVEMAAAAGSVLQRLPVLAAAGMHVVRASQEVKTRAAVAGSSSSNPAASRASEELRAAAARALASLIKVAQLGGLVADWIRGDPTGLRALRLHEPAAGAVGAGGTSATSSDTGLPDWVQHSLASVSTQLSADAQEVFYAMDKQAAAAAGKETERAASGAGAPTAERGDRDEDGAAASAQRQSKAASKRAQAAGRRVAKLAAAAQRVQPRLLAAADECAVKVAALRRRLGLSVDAVQMPQQRDYRFKNLDRSIRRRYGAEKLG